VGKNAKKILKRCKKYVKFTSFFQGLEVVDSTTFLHTFYLFGHEKDAKTK
jgi:hypothetical protein